MFGFHYLSLKVSLTLPNKEKMLWCSYFRSFIKYINLDRCGNLIKKINFVSTSWKIIIPIAHHPPYHPPNTPSPSTLPTLPTTTHSIPHQHTTHPTTIHSTTLTPPHHQPHPINHPPHPSPAHSPTHHHHPPPFIKSANFSRCGNFIKKLNFVSNPWKINIPLGNSEEDHIWVIEIHLSG